MLSAIWNPRVKVQLSGCEHLGFEFRVQDLGLGILWLRGWGWCSAHAGTSGTPFKVPLHPILQTRVLTTHETKPKPYKV